MPQGFLICATCFSIFILNFDEGDECPYCECGELEDYEIFLNNYPLSFLIDPNWRDDGS